MGRGGITSSWITAGLGSPACSDRAAKITRARKLCPCPRRKGTDPRRSGGLGEKEQRWKRAAPVLQQEGPQEELRGMEVLLPTPPAGPRQPEVIRIYREPAGWEGQKGGRQNLEEEGAQNLEERAVGTNTAHV